MICENELKQLFLDNEILAFKLSDSPSAVHMSLDISLEDFIVFLKAQSQSTVFYNYEYYNPYDYLITEDIIAHADIEIDTKNKSAIDEYNKKVLDIDYSKPCSLEIITIVDRVIFEISFEEDWLNDEHDFLEPEVALFSIISNTKSTDYDEIYDQYYSDIDKKKKKKDLENKRILVDFLIKDDKFRMCTNQSLRRSYVKELSDYNPELNTVLSEIFPSHTGIIPTSRFNFVDLVYKCLKSGITDIETIIRY